MPRPKTKALEEALEKLEAARDDLVAAFEHVVEQVDLSPIAEALTVWRQAAEAFADEARSVHEDASAYYEERSERWQHSDKGQAFITWMEELERLTDFDGEPMDTVCIDVDLSSDPPVAGIEHDPSHALPDLPDIPELEE